MFDFLGNHIKHGRLLFCGFPDLEFGLEKYGRSDLKCFSRFILLPLVLHHYKKETIERRWFRFVWYPGKLFFPRDGPVLRAAEVTPLQFLELSYQLAISYLQTDEFWLRKERRVRWRFHLNFRFIDFVIRHLWKCCR